MKAAQSIPNNIAEGHESGSDKKFVRFLRYAKGSSAEVRSMLYSALDFEYITQKQFTDLSKQTVSISVKLSNLIDYLQQSKKS